MFAVELHCHSRRSHDGRDPVEALLDQARERNLDAIAITDHDTIEASLRAVELAPSFDLVAIPGVEISTRAGHVLGLGVTEPIQSGQSFQETVDRVHDDGGIAIVPHPFQELREGVLRSISTDEIVAADGIETYNSRILTGRSNRQAEALAAKYSLPMTAGSDAHVKEMVGRAVTLVDAPERSADAILDAIRAGETRIDGQRTPYRVTLRQAAGTAKRRIRREFFP